MNYLEDFSDDSARQDIQILESLDDASDYARDQRRQLPEVAGAIILENTWTNTGVVWRVV